MRFRASLWLGLWIAGACSLDREPLDEPSRLSRPPQFGASSGAGATGGTSGTDTSTGGSGGVGGNAGSTGGTSGAAGSAGASGTGGSGGSGGASGAGGSGGTSGAAGSSGAPTVTDCTLAPDADGDGYDAVDCGGEDCDDASGAINPDGIDVCNGLDDDCNGAPDDGLIALGCLLPSAAGICNAGHCEVLSCLDGAQDCDAAAANGCEVIDNPRGDCKHKNCAGKLVSEDSDLPLDDGEECTIEECDSGNPVVRDAPNGTECGDGGQCDGGKCAD